MTEASEMGTEAVLEQEGSPVNCIPRLINAAEGAFPDTERSSHLILNGAQPSQIFVQPEVHDYQ